MKQIIIKELAEVTNTDIKERSLRKVRKWLK